MLLQQNFSATEMQKNCKKNVLKFFPASLFLSKGRQHSGMVERSSDNLNSLVDVFDDHLMSCPKAGTWKRCSLLSCFSASLIQQRLVQNSQMIQLIFS